MELRYLKPKLNYVALQITDRCNFRCDHCCQGERGENGFTDLSSGDAATLVRKITSPKLDQIEIYGGEPRVHPKFGEVTAAITQNLHRQESVTGEELNQYLDEYRKLREEYERKIPEEERNRLIISGELEVAVNRHIEETGLVLESGTSVGVFTNGFGITSEEKGLQLVDELKEIGVTGLTISTDPPHQRYTESHSISVNYAVVNKMTSYPLKEKMGIPSTFHTAKGGNGEYVIPIGRARKYTWKQRLADGRHGYSPDFLQETMDQIEKEFVEWGEIGSFSHGCYCGPAKLQKRIERVAGYEPDNQIVTHGLTVLPTLDASYCPFNIIPPAGNLLVETPDQILRNAVSSRLYTILGHFGPQGLAVEITGKPIESFRKDFVERTPCGLCEDVCREYPEKVKELFETKMV